MEVENKNFTKTFLASISILALIAIFILFNQVHRLHKQLNTQKDALAQTNTEITTLNANSAQLQDSLKNLQDSQMSLKQIQASSISLALINLQHDLLQGSSKASLLNTFATIQILSENLHAASVNTNLMHLASSLNQLPNINPSQAIQQLQTLQAGIASLSFVTSIPDHAASESGAMNPTTNSSFKKILATIWQQIKSLVIVRSDNAIGTQLVSAAARFDAMRQINLLTQQAEWQILTTQDPSTTLTQLKIAITAYTTTNPAQTAWLSQFNQVQNSNNYYNNSQIQAVLTAINNLQQALILE
jgi:hypothetical protein